MLPVWMLVGLAVGTIAAGPMGGLLGLALGAVAGLMLPVTHTAVRRLPAGDRAAHERHELLCIPKGQIAQATFLRDAEDGQWLDVERCSLCGPDEAPTCSKRCLVMMRDAMPPHPRHRPMAAAH